MHRASFARPEVEGRAWRRSAKGEVDPDRGPPGPRADLDQLGQPLHHPQPAPALVVVGRATAADQGIVQSARVAHLADQGPRLAPAPGAARPRPRGAPSWWPARRRRAPRRGPVGVPCRRWRPPGRPGPGRQGARNGPPRASAPVAPGRRAGLRTSRPARAVQRRRCSVGPDPPRTEPDGSWPPRPRPPGPTWPGRRGNRDATVAPTRRRGSRVTRGAGTPPAPARSGTG